MQPGHAPADRLPSLQIGTRRGIIDARIGGMLVMIGWIAGAKPAVAPDFR